MESTIKNRSNRSYKYEAIKATGVTTAVGTVISADFWRQLLTKQVNDIAFYDVLRDFERDERNKVILSNIDYKITTIQGVTISDTQKEILQQNYTIYFEIIINDYAFTYNYNFTKVDQVQLFGALDVVSTLKKVLADAVCYKHNLQLIESTLISEAF